MYTRRLLVMMVVALSTMGQSPDEQLARTKEQLLLMSEKDVVEYLDLAVAANLPAHAVDALTFLVLNREAFLLPALSDRLRGMLQGSDDLGRVREKLGDILAYAGSEASTQALLDLFAEKPKFVGELLRWSLTYRASREDPFPIAYRMLNASQAAVRLTVLDWVEVNLFKGRNAEYLARAMIARLGGVVTEADFAEDPIVQRLGMSDRALLRRELDKQIQLMQEKAITDKTIQQ